MKIEFPKIAVVAPYAGTRSDVSVACGKVIPCQSDYFTSFETIYHSRNLDYQFIFLDLNSIPGSTILGKKELLIDLAKKYPSSRTKKMLLSRVQPGENEAELWETVSTLLNDKVIDKFVHEKSGDLSGGGNSQQMLRQLSEASLDIRVTDDITRGLTSLREGDAFRLHFPVLVYGGGKVGAEIVKGLVAAGIETHWFSESAAAKEYIHKNVKIAYEGLMMLREILPEEPPNLNYYKSLDDALTANPAFIINANADFLPMKPARNREERLGWLYEQAFPKNKKLVDKMIQHKSDANLFNCSNPPEALLHYPLRKGIEKSRLFTGLPDPNRAKYIVSKFFKNHPELRKYEFVTKDIEVILMGQHQRPLYDTRLVSINTFDWKLQEYITSNLASLNHRFEVHSGEHAVEFALQQYGDQVMRSYQSYLGAEIPYSDAAHATADNLIRISQFKPPLNCGYYFSNYGTFFLGPPPRINYANLEFSIEPNQDFRGIMKDHKLDLKELADKTKELVAKRI